MSQPNETSPPLHYRRSGGSRESVLALAGTANFLTSCKLKFNSRVPTTITSSPLAFLRTFSFLHSNVCVREPREEGKKRGKEIERGKLYGSRFKKETEVAESYRRSGSKTFEILDHFYEAVRKEVRRIVYHEGRKRRYFSSSKRDCASFASRNVISTGSNEDLRNCRSTCVCIYIYMYRYIYRSASRINLPITNIWAITTASNRKQRMDLVGQG